MQLEEITGKMLKQALEIYCRYAWPKATAKRFSELLTWAEELTGEKLLEKLNDESSKTEGAESRRFTIRAGNQHYPFMKLGLEEWVRQGEFFLYVATHDEMELAEDDPDFHARQKIRENNLGLKRKIEAAWNDAGLPTLKDTKALCPFVPGTKSAIIGQNTGYEAETIAALLGEEGYTTIVVSDVERLRVEMRRCRPDIVLVDSFVGEVAGHVIAENLRNQDDLGEIPIILMVSPFDHLEHSEATALLIKPVTIEALRHTLEEVRDKKRR